MKLIIKDNCLLCDKKFNWGEPVLTKLPENACFCLDCSGKFEDKKEYKGINAWSVVEYQPGIEFIYGPCN